MDNAMLNHQLIYHIRLKNFEDTERIFLKDFEVYYNQIWKHSANCLKIIVHCKQE